VRLCIANPLEYRLPSNSSGPARSPRSWRGPKNAESASTSGRLPKNGFQSSDSGSKSLR